jgi:hypothetical protein
MPFAQTPGSLPHRANSPTVLPARSCGRSIPLSALTNRAEWRKLRFGKIGSARNGEFSRSNVRRK